MIPFRSFLLTALSAILIGDPIISAQSSHGGLKLISDNKVIYEDHDILKLCADLAYGTNKDHFSQSVIDGIREEIYLTTGAVVIKEMRKLNHLTYMQIIKHEKKMIVRYLVPGNTCRFWISKTKAPLFPWLSDITFEIEWDMLIELSTDALNNLADLQFKNKSLHADVNCRVLFMNGRRKDEDALIIEQVTTWAKRDKGVLKQLQKNAAQLFISDSLNNFLKQNLQGWANGRTTINETPNFGIENHELTISFHSGGRSGFAMSAYPQQVPGKPDALYLSYAHRLREISKLRKRTERTFNN